MSRSLISSSRNPPIQIDDELPEGYYKNLIRTLKQHVDSKDNSAEHISLKKKVTELEFLLSKEKSVVDKLEKKVTKEKELYDYFFWKDDELPEGYYKNLIRTLKQHVDSKDNSAEHISLKKKVTELEFLLSKEKSVVDKLEKKVTKEKELVMMLNNKLEVSMQQNSMLKVLVVVILLVVALWCFK
uniref:Uncharacterized protein n=1 Tax=Lactuca sativa TaxID=4236 RepID=A0A9R1WVY4_LACSA|nr:hypothetical protein LSAT_V11C800420960 [Lactuca sativa]